MKKPYNSPIVSQSTFMLLVLLRLILGSHSYTGTSPFTSSRLLSNRHSASNYYANRRSIISVQVSKPSYEDDTDAHSFDGEISAQAQVQVSRRKAIFTSTITAMSVFLPTTTIVNSPSTASAFELPNPFLPVDRKSNGGIYQPAKRSLVYLVDSTIPPTLVPFSSKSRLTEIMKRIAGGYGTSKSPFIEEGITLNNMMNKGVFGTIDFVKSLVSNDDNNNTSTINTSDNDDDSNRSSQSQKKKGAYNSSFLFLGVDYYNPTTTQQDVDLTLKIINDILKFRKNNFDSNAIALDFLPYTLQPKLNDYLSNLLNDGDILQAIIDATGLSSSSSSTTQQYILSILQFAKSKQITILACAPLPEDLDTVRKNGLQSLNVDQRSKYVVDSQGFIAWTQEPKNRLYTDKSLLKDFTPTSVNNSSDNNNNDKGNTTADYFAERILVHETMATLMSQYAITHPKSLLIGLAPTKDVRFMGGPNGRVVRVCQFLKPNTNIDDDAVTTILVNPTAKKTLSASKFLRLEIGTAPENILYQTKVADYLWFSEMPKVNMLPRMMNGY